MIRVRLLLFAVLGACCTSPIELAQQAAAIKAKCNSILTHYNKELNQTLITTPPRSFYVHSYFVPPDPKVVANARRMPLADESSLNARAIEQGVRLSFYFLSPGTNPVAPITITLGLEATGIWARFSESQTLWADMDSHTLLLANPIFTSNTDSAWGKQSLRYELSLDTVVRLSQAQKLKLRVNKTEMPFTDCDRQHLWELANWKPKP